MQKRNIGKSNIEVSALTLGCMSLGTNEAHATEIINQALDSGINHLDTADLYDFGQNESIVGKAIKAKRDKIVLTSKVGNHFNPTDKTTFWDPSKQHIESAIKDTLHRLQTDYLDFYLLHGGTIDDPIDETVEAFESLKKAGLIRAYGISSIRPNVIREYIKKSSIDVVMMQYSLLDRRPEEIFDELSANDISVFARGPLAKGMLSNQGINIAEQKVTDTYLDYNQDELITTIKSLQEQTDDLTATALHYTLQDPVVASAVFGASSIQQLNENIAAFKSIDMPEATYLACKTSTKLAKYELRR